MERVLSSSSGWLLLLSECYSNFWIWVVGNTNSFFVRDRVMETVAQSKTLPADMASQRLGNVNLFMRAIGLDVELLG